MEWLAKCTWKLYYFGEGATTIFQKSESKIYAQKNTEDKISIKGVIGGGYDEFWRSKKRYMVCKGSRASKKSTTAALKLIVKLMQMPLANALVVRQTAATLKDSCYAQLQWAIEKLGVGKFWKATVNPLQLVYLPTGQKIIFRGCDDAEKIKSITVSKGFICFAWLEEASEVNFDEFDKIDKSLRAQMPEGYYIQWMVTFNPTNVNSWQKSYFFDTPRDNVLAMTTTYKCNEWLSDEFLELMEWTKKTDPDRYKVDRLGEWA